MKRQAAMISVVASALFLSGLTGCERRRIEEVRPVEWYEANPAERAQKLIECESGSGKFDAPPGCVNASRAENNVKATTKQAPESEVRTTPLESRRGDPAE